MYKKIVLQPAVKEMREVIITPEKSEEREVGPGYVQLWHNGQYWVDNRGTSYGRRSPELKMLPPHEMFIPYSGANPSKYVALFVPDGVAVETAIADFNALTKKQA